MSKAQVNVIIQTGFEAISHTILFQPQTMNKGKLLVAAGHVRDVKEFRECGQSYQINSKVIRQTSVTLPPYDTRLYLNDERVVEKVICTCVYNQSGKCKHVAALIYFINHEESLTKTSYEQQWGKPSARQFVKEKYSKGRNFCEMFPKKPATNNNENHPPPVDLQELVDESALKQVLVADQKSDYFYTIQNFLKSLVSAVDLNLKQEDCQEILENFRLFNDECIVYSNQCKLEKDLTDFYNNKIMMNNNDICKLCCETIDQSQCPQWFEARRLRLSASSKIHNIKIRTRKTIEKLANDILYPVNIDSDSTNYGLSQENSARKKYEELNDCEVKKTGVIVCQKQPWLCASLDGVVIHDGCIEKLVEIKCPIKCKSQPVVDRVIGTCNVKYLYFENGEVQLKKNEPYFTQIQVQLYVTGMFSCDLFIYSQVSDGCCTVPVHRDEAFLKQVILGAETFYFNHYLPAVYLKFTEENDSNMNGNVELLSQRKFTGVNVINNI